MEQLHPYFRRRLTTLIPKLNPVKRASMDSLDDLDFDTDEDIIDGKSISLKHAFSPPLKINHKDGYSVFLRDSTAG